ncbi:hypothetical protein GH733_014400, partial [Mirounga leonina]
MPSQAFRAAACCSYTYKIRSFSHFPIGMCRSSGAKLDVRETTGIETEHPEFLYLLESPEPHSKANETISV